MSTIEQSVDALEYKLHQVLQKLSHFKTANQQLVEDLEKAKRKINKQQQDIAQWQDQYQSLKIANTMLGSSNNDKRETKLKINALIRDIDHCITQLSK